MKKKITKRIFTLLLTAMLVFPFAACGKSTPKPTESNPPAVLPGESVTFDVLYEDGIDEPIETDIGFNVTPGTKMVFQSGEALEAYNAHLNDNFMFVDLPSLLKISDASSYFDEKMVMALFLGDVEIDGKEYGQYELSDVRTVTEGGKTKYYVYFDYIWTTDYVPSPSHTVAVPTFDPESYESIYLYYCFVELPQSKSACNESDVEIIVNYVEKEQITSNAS
jgi:hypothetical protein